MHADTSGQTSHERMLRAALQLFAQHGFTHTSTAQIAHAAGTSESQLIKHFGTKEGLLEAIFEAAWRRLNVEAATLATAADSPAEGIRMVMRFVLGRLEKEPDLKRLMLFEGRRVRARGLAITAGFQQFVDRLDSLLARARRAGEFRERVPVAAVRSVLVGAFEGLLRDRVLALDAASRAPYSARDIERLMDAVIATFLRPRRARRARAR